MLCRFSSRKIIIVGTISSCNYNIQRSMIMNNGNKMDSRKLAAMAIMGALTTVVTMFALPFAPTGGFFNLGDAIVMTTAIVFGPIVGAVAGGVGSALADLLLGYSAFAPFTLIIKGLEGFLIGTIVGTQEKPSLVKLGIAWVVGGVTIVGGYWFAEAFIMGLGVPAANAEIIINIPQAVGSIIGIPIALGVKSRLKI
jgi:uncharacterized membrane protein